MPEAPKVPWRNQQARPLKVFKNEGQQAGGEGDGQPLNRQALYPLRMVP